MDNNSLVEIDLHSESESIPILNSSILSSKCKKCGKNFYRDEDTSIINTNYYYCENCLDTNRCLFNFFNICNIQ